MRRRIAALVAAQQHEVDEQPDDDDQEGEQHEQHAAAARDGVHELAQPEAELGLSARRRGAKRESGVAVDEPLQLAADLGRAAAAKLVGVLRRGRPRCVPQPGLVADLARRSRPDRVHVARLLGDDVARAGRRAGSARRPASAGIRRSGRRCGRSHRRLRPPARPGGGPAARRGRSGRSATRAAGRAVRSVDSSTRTRRAKCTPESAPKSSTRRWRRRRPSCSSRVEVVAPPRGAPGRRPSARSDAASSGALPPAQVGNCEREVAAACVCSQKTSPRYRPARPRGSRRGSSARRATSSSSRGRCSPCRRTSCLLVHLGAHRLDAEREDLVAELALLGVEHLALPGEEVDELGRGPGQLRARLDEHRALGLAVRDLARRALRGTARRARPGTSPSGRGRRSACQAPALPPPTGRPRLEAVRELAQRTAEVRVVPQERRRRIVLSSTQSMPAWVYVDGV